MDEGAAIATLNDRHAATGSRLEAIAALASPSISNRGVAALKMVLADQRASDEEARAAIACLLSSGHGIDALGAGGRASLRRGVVERLAVLPLDPRRESAFERDLEIVRTADDPQRATKLVNAGARYGPHPRLVSALRVAAHDPDPGIRWSAVNSLAVIGELAPVLAALHDEDGRVRAYAAAALGNFGFGEEREVDALTEATADPDKQVRDNAATALRRLGAKKRRSSGKRAAAPHPGRWGTLLGSVSRARIADSHYAAQLDDDTVASGWLGRPPATAADVRAAEERLGLSLPPSYREFVLTSDGFVGLPASLLAVAEIGRLTDKAPDTAKLWMEEPAFEISDEAYGVYGPAQDPVLFRSAYIPALVMVGPDEEFGCYLLNPEVTFADGEWEAWKLDSSLPGAARYRSFYELAEAEARELGKP